MLEQLDKATREDLYRYLAELLWAELHDGEETPNAEEAAEHVARDLEPTAR